MTKKTAPHTKIGDNPSPEDQPGVYCLLLDEWFGDLVKKTYCGKEGCNSNIDSTVNVFNYFITSGEAVKKAEQLNKDAWTYAGKCRALLAALKKARGDSMYLEITSENGMLICRRKDPRKPRGAPPAAEQYLIFMEAQFPHCDSRILHAPGECKYCDKYPDRQRLREVQGINFTGKSDVTKSKCPAETARSLDIINHWRGNIPVAPFGHN